MGNEGSRSNTNGTVAVQGPQQDGVNGNNDKETIHVDRELGVVELNGNEPTVDPQPVIDKVDEQNTDSYVDKQQNGDQNGEKTVETIEKKKPKKRSFFSKEKVKLRDKKDKVKNIEKDIKIESIVEDNVKPEVVIPEVDLVNGEQENQNDVTPPALPDKIGKENTEKPATKKKDDKEEKKRLKEEKKRLKEEKKRSKSKKQKNDQEQEEKVQPIEITVNTDNTLCICPGIENTPQDTEHKETQNDETKDTTNLTNITSENLEVVNEKAIDITKDVSSDVNKEIEIDTSAIPNTANINSENIVKQNQEDGNMSNEQVEVENSKSSVVEELKQNLDQSYQMPSKESDKSTNSDQVQMTSKDSLNNLLMVEEDVITLEDADTKIDADDVTVEGATNEGGDENISSLPVISQPEKVNEKISETEVTDVESRDNADKEKQGSEKVSEENLSENLCNVSNVVSEIVSECKEIDIIVKESEAISEPQAEKESVSLKLESVQTNDDSKKLIVTSVESESNNDQVQLKDNEEETCKDACDQSKQNKTNSDEEANETIESSSESKLESEEENASKLTEAEAESKLLDETNNNCNQTERTANESKEDNDDEKVVSENDKSQAEFKDDSVNGITEADEKMVSENDHSQIEVKCDSFNGSLDADEKMVSENDKSQAEFKSESVNVSIVSENEERSVEIKETLVDEKTTLEINHDSQMESTTDDLKENSLDENSVSEKVTESVEETIAQKQTDKTEEEEETLPLQSEEISPNPKTITDDKGNKSKVKDKKKKDKTKKRSKINSESSHDTVSVTSSSHSDKTESPKSKNKDKSKKKSSKQKDLRDNDSITASECVSNTSDLDHSISEIHKDDDSQCANDKKVVKETVSVDSHEKRKSGNIFSWNLLKSHKTEEEKDKKKKVKMRGVGKDMIQHTVNDAEEANKRRSIFDEEIHIELDDSHDIVSLSSLESDTNSECSSLSETSDNKETQSIVNFDEPDELKLNTQNTGTNNDQDSESMTVLRTGPIPDLLITKSDVEKSQDKSSSNNAITVRENKDEIENVGQDLEPRETVSKSHIESKEKSAIKISIKVEGKYVDPVIYGTSSYHGNGVETQTRGTQTEYVARKQHKVQYNNEDNKINEINEHQDSEKEGHNFSSHLHGFIHKYTLPLVVKAGHSRKNIYGMKKEKNLMFRRHMSDESGYIATNSCNLTRPLSFQYKESKPEMDHDQGEVGSLQLSKYKINQRQPTNEKQGNPDNKSLSTAAKGESVLKHAEDKDLYSQVWSKRVTLTYNSLEKTILLVLETFT